ncbi:MAG: ABC transporter substrate-binding protein [Kangiellaceae bacterium]|nr:ABC transporter substrate-binding protein [Kangiellaceae bacterium]MCW9016612.1 ABC transporter substrate-binding protein [Kangiellaceae bacterium]
MRFSLLHGIVSLILLVASSLSHANGADEATVYFKGKVSRINQTLAARQAEFKADPTKLVEYVDQELIPLWSSEKTMKGLVGTKNWKQISESNQSKLAASFNNTLQRYVQEGFEEYDGQSVKFVKLRLNSKKSKGILTLEVIPNLLPSFNIDLKVGSKNGNWQIYDVLVQGVSYISLKKEKIRQILDKNGVQALIKDFSDKNQGFMPSSVVKVAAK